MNTNSISAAAFAFSIVAAVVSIFSLAATSAKLKLDLYNRRFKIYEDVLALYQTIYDRWDDKNTKELERAMIRSFRESKYLFREDDGIYDVLLKIKDANAKNASYYRFMAEHPNNADTAVLLAHNAFEGRRDFDMLILELEQKLSKYLDFTKIHGWM